MNNWKDRLADYFVEVAETLQNLMELALTLLAIVLMIAIPIIVLALWIDGDAWLPIRIGATVFGAVFEVMLLVFVGR